MHSRILWVNSFPIAYHIFSCPSGCVCLSYRSSLITHIPAGIRLQDALGFMKLGILLIVVGAGLIALTGNLEEGVLRPGNFE
jgi:hypothetical protein